LYAIEDESLAPSVELALAQLRGYASKSKTLANKDSTRLGQPSVRLKTKVVTTDGKTFVTATLADGVKALGITDKIEIHTAWKKINTIKFKAGEVVDFDGHKFSLTNETPTYSVEQDEEVLEGYE
jgi:hypothetical protein